MMIPLPDKFNGFLFQSGTGDIGGLMIRLTMHVNGAVGYGLWMSSCTLPSNERAC